MATLQHIIFTAAFAAMLSAGCSSEPQTQTETTSKAEVTPSSSNTQIAQSQTTQLQETLTPEKNSAQAVTPVKHDPSAQSQSIDKAPESEPVKIDHIYTESPNDLAVGSTTAPHTLIAYASVTCPHCSQWFINEWPEFKARHVDNGNVRFILREFPTAPAEMAWTGFLLANCAPSAERFDHVIYQMQIQSAIFEAVQAGEGRSIYEELAKRAGLTTEGEINACFRNSEANAKIKQSLERARATKITMVPSFVLNGEIIKEEPTLENLSRAISNASDR